MFQIKSSNTKPELILKKMLKGFKSQPNLFGKPDFVDYNNKIVIFVDGCFWHQCPLHSKKPSQNVNYWEPKLERNKIRAKEVNIAYELANWKVIRIWEHEVSNNLNNCLKKLKKFY